MNYHILCNKFDKEHEHSSWI